MPFYRLLITRDATESAVVGVKADDKDQAFELARERVAEKDWELDEGNYRDAGDIYLGDDDNDIVEIDEDEYLALTATSEPLPPEAEDALAAAVCEDLADHDRLTAVLHRHRLALPEEDETDIVVEVQNAIIEVLRRRVKPAEPA